MKKNIFKLLMVAGIATVLISSCAKKLDLFPTNDLTAENVYANPTGYKSVLAKIYGTLAITGNAGPAGAPDINGGLDEGSQVAFLRMFFNCQELPTDEAVVGWNDQTIQDFHNMKWTSADPFLKGIYARPIYNITLINEYLREATDAKLAERNITGAAADDIKKSRAEARYLRAFNYWVMLDLFGKSTFITEADLVGATRPAEISRANLFTYIETELKAIEGQLGAVRTAEYGRVDQGADWALLARLYLNAGVYTGTPRYTDAITYAKKVIGGGYGLQPNYRQLFMADNDKRKDEFMFTINCDGLRTQAYGNTTFFIHAPAGDDHNHYGANSGWGGYRATKALADLFTDPTGATDKRAMFTTPNFGTSPSQFIINNVTVFAEGVHVAKYRNIRSDAGAVSDVTNNFSDVDFAVFRLPEMYFIYAEAFLRGGTGADATTAKDYLNLVRTRAGATPAFGPSDLTLQNILDERGRELYWEGHRRTDLIRYNLLTTGTYLWPLKGGVLNGTAVLPRYNLFPIPDDNRTANSNLSQNLGYPQ